eukprot:GHUV01014173.1.p1 GENE.GHUV01014173.1~~GHUV01014173.1.p1  ORF type:complete len:213 (+),score=46.03 GHUV01014173.1:384-1022(+)
MGNACGKPQAVRDEQSAGSVQRTPPKSISSKAEPLTPPLKAKEQQEDKKGVRWSIPADANSQQPTADPVETPQPALAVQEAAPGQPVSKRRIDCKIKDAYKLGKTLGTGGFAIVKLATDKKTGEQYAVKIMTLPALGVEPGDNENTRYACKQQPLAQCLLKQQLVSLAGSHYEFSKKPDRLEDLPYCSATCIAGGPSIEDIFLSFWIAINTV